MNVLMINTSPHENGCTNRALQEVASVLSQWNINSEILWIGKGSYMDAPIVGTVSSMVHAYLPMIRSMRLQRKLRRLTPLYWDQRYITPLPPGLVVLSLIECSVLPPSRWHSSRGGPLWSLAEGVGQALPSTS